MQLLDQAIVGFDQALRTLQGSASASRDYPGLAPQSTMAQPDRDHAAGLMRVNHSGEVCAQALYQGQALVARDEANQALLRTAAAEERDHLAWCQQRLEELNASPSILNPVWYAGSFTLGVASGLLGDRWSLGFLVETERQVEAHLNDHEDRLPAADTRSRQVVSAMREDEIKHRESGIEHGAAELPRPAKDAMRLASKLMTKTAYWL